MASGLYTDLWNTQSAEVKITLIFFNFTWRSVTSDMRRLKKTPYLLTYLLTEKQERNRTNIIFLLGVDGHLYVFEFLAVTKALPCILVLLIELLASDLITHHTMHNVRSINQ